jgi:hypothetical protein
LAGEVVEDLTSFLADSRGQQKPWSSAGIFQTIIRRNIKLAECPSFGQVIFQYAPGSHGAQDYMALAGEVLAMEPGAAAAADTPGGDSPANSEAGIRNSELAAAAPAGSGADPPASDSAPEPRSASATGPEPQPGPAPELGATPQSSPELAPAESGAGSVASSVPGADAGPGLSAGPASPASSALTETNSDEDKPGHVDPSGQAPATANIQHPEPAVQPAVGAAVPAADQPPAV